MTTPIIGDAAWRARERARHTRQWLVQGALALVIVLVLAGRVAAALLEQRDASPQTVRPARAQLGLERRDVELVELAEQARMPTRAIESLLRELLERRAIAEFAEALLELGEQHLVLGLELVRTREQLDDARALGQARGAPQPPDLLGRIGELGRTRAGQLHRRLAPIERADVRIVYGLEDVEPRDAENGLRGAPSLHLAASVGQPETICTRLTCPLFSRSHAAPRSSTVVTSFHTQPFVESAGPTSQ